LLAHLKGQICIACQLWSVCHASVLCPVVISKTKPDRPVVTGYKLAPLIQLPRSDHPQYNPLGRSSGFIYVQILKPPRIRPWHHTQLLSTDWDRHYGTYC